MGKAKLVLYYDIVSPFAYMAYYMTRTSPVFKPCDVSYVPMFLGGVMKAAGNQIPLSIKNKSTWINVERRRWATLFNIPMPHDAPDGFPVLTLTIQRALTAITQLSPESLLPVTDALYGKYWAERNVERVDKPEGLGKLLTQVLGADLAKQVMEKTGSDEVKKLLNQRTQESFDEGAFGLPFFIATNAEGKTETFWGFDHIGQLTLFLGLEKPQTLGGWQAML